MCIICASTRSPSSQRCSLLTPATKLRKRTARTRSNYTVLGQSSERVTRGTCSASARRDYLLSPCAYFMRCRPTLAKFQRDSNDSATMLGAQHRWLLRRKAVLRRHSDSLCRFMWLKKAANKSWTSFCLPSHSFAWGCISGPIPGLLFTLMLMRLLPSEALLCCLLVTGTGANLSLFILLL